MVITPAARYTQPLRHCLILNFSFSFLIFFLYFNFNFEILILNFEILFGICYFGLIVY